MKEMESSSSSSSSSSASDTSCSSSSRNLQRKFGFYFKPSTTLVSVVTLIATSLLVVSILAFNASTPLFSSPSSSSSSPASLSFDVNGGKEQMGTPFLFPNVHGKSADGTSDQTPAPSPSAEDNVPPQPPPLPLPPKVQTPESNLSRIEQSLARARSAIRRSITERNATKSNLKDDGYVPRGRVYRNAVAFHRSYLEMEKFFKVYVYEEGEPPLAHDGPCREIYSMEGRFIYNMEVDKRFRTRDPNKAHVYFLPFSITKMVRYVYDRSSFDRSSLLITAKDYIRVVSERYPFWNRSRGVDHFILTCHDWGPHVSTAVPDLYKNSIRVLCNANTSEGFNPAKDATLPEMNLKFHDTVNIINLPPLRNYTILGFFAGALHGPIRPVLFQHWMGKDQEIQVYRKLPQGVNYYDMMRKAKFCICPSGFEVASPRIVEAIYLQCVPVIISDNYVFPFSDVLNWAAFSVQVEVGDIPNLKSILMGISEKKYQRMKGAVKVVQRHFIVRTPPARFDVFHMLLHSIWLRRMNFQVHPTEEQIG